MSFITRCFLAAIFVQIVFAQNTNYSLPGSYQVGRKGVTVDRNDGQEAFSALLFYPSTSAGEDAIPSSTGGPFPVVSFAHGFLGPPVIYTSLMTHIASYGYVVIATGSEVTTNVNQTRYVEDILRSAQYVEQLSGPFQNVVQTKNVGLVGHSMGGGAIFRAALKDPSIKVLIGLAAAANSTQTTGVAVPSRMIVGTNDTVVPSSTALSQWQGLTGPSQIYEIIGGTHCGFIDLDAEGLPICDKAVMPRAEQRVLQQGLVVEYLNEYLKPSSNPSNSTSWINVWGPGAVSPVDKRLKTTIDPRITMSPNNVTTNGASVSYVLNSNRPEPISYTPIVPSGVTASSSTINQLTQGTPQNFTVSLPPKAKRANTQYLISMLNNADKGTRGFATVNVGTPPSSSSTRLLIGILSLTGLFIF